jgi:hypothetical protein
MRRRMALEPDRHRPNPVVHCGTPVRQLRPGMVRAAPRAAPDDPLRLGERHSARADGLVEGVLDAVLRLRPGARLRQGRSSRDAHDRLVSQEDPNAGVVRAYVGAFNRGDAFDVAAVCSPACVIWGVLGHGGLDAAIPVWRMLVESFAMRLTIEDLIADGDREQRRCRDHLPRASRSPHLAVDDHRAFGGDRARVLL